MQIVAMVGYKGGTGKTTLAVNVADVLAERVPTVLIDTDPQASARAWIEGAEHLRVELVTDPGELERIASQAWDGLVVIDGRPGDPVLTETVVRMADLVVVPLRPSALDLHANRPLLEQLGKRGLVVLTMTPARSRDAEMIRELVVERHGVAVAATSVGQRVVYSRAPMWQQSVCDVEPSGAAAGEILAVADEIAAAIGLS